MTIATHTDTATWLGILGQHTMLLLTNAQGQILKASPAFCRASGYAMSELQHSELPSLHAPSFGAEWWSKLWRMVSAGRVWRGQICNLNKAGQTYWVDVHAMPVSSQTGHIEGVFLLEVDITAYRQLEQELRRGKEEAEAATAAKGQFLAAMSHDIRTPMNAILGLLKLLQSTELSTRQNEYAVKAEGAARSLLGLINDILDFSKVEAGKLVLDPQAFLVERLMRDLSVILSANVGKKQVELLFDIDPELPPALVADAMRLQQVLINLGGNAIKFTETGEVVVSLRLMAYQGDCALVRFAVRDTGIGVAQENVKHIFEQFSQAERSTTRRFGGTGLGLAICQHFVHLMGGTIQVESRLGVGSEFFFEISLPVAEASAVDDNLLLPNLSDNKSLRVLLVDDNLTALQLLADICRSLGWVVDVASSGHQAVALLNRSVTQQKAYDLAIVDDQMPGMSGWETVRCIRQRELQPPCHLLLVTANNHQNWFERSTAEQAWVNGVLTKPVTASTLFDAVVRYPEKGLDQHLKATRASKPKRLMAMRLLVVEDNAINQQVASELLTAEGANVTLASDGQQGVQAVLSASKMPFDAVLMDMEMPVMNGITATRELRQIHKRDDLVIIAMTANAMESDKRACLAAGMDAHVSKPLDMEQLVRTLLQYAPKDLARRQVHAAQTVPLASTPQAVGQDKTMTFSSSSVLDVRKAIERLGGESEVYFELVEPFIEDSSHLMAQLKLTASQQQGQELARHLHTLKGIAATMGADDLADLARQLESDVKTQLTLRATPELNPDKIAQLEAGLSAVHDALHQALEQQTKTTLSTSGASPDLDSQARPPDALLTKLELDEQLRQGLQHLADLLRKADLTALSLYRELQQHHAVILQTHGHLLAELISTFDFEHAATQCDALLNKLPLTSKA